MHAAVDDDADADADDDKTDYDDGHEQPVRQSILFRYGKKKQVLNGIEQDDMVPLALQLFWECPEEKQKAIDKYHYVMVDEFQVRRRRTGLPTL